MKLSKIILMLLVLIFVSYDVNAFGVVAPNSPIVVSIGETKDLSLSIQNGAGATEDVITKIEVLEGSEIIQLDQEEYLVPANGEITAKLKIIIPRDANIDGKWNVKLSFKATPKGKEGMVSMGYGVIINFDVLAQQPTETPTGKVTKEILGYNTNVILAVLIIIATLIILYILERKKKTKKKK